MLSKYLVLVRLFIEIKKRDENLIAIVIDKIDNVFHSSEEIKKDRKLPPLLGTIPFFKFSFPRPVTVVIILEEDLFINTPGDLKLDNEKNLKIENISWNLPLA